MLDVPLFLLGLNVNAAPSGGGGGSYTAKAVHVDGTTWLRNAALAATDNGTCTTSVWFKIPAINSGEMWVSDPEGNFSNSSGFSTGAGTFDQVIADTACVNGLSVASAAPTGAWSHFLITADGISGFAKCYVNGVDAGLAPLDYRFGNTPAPLDMYPMNGKSMTIFNDTFDDFVVGDVADLWIAPGVSLLNGGNDIPLATLRKFIDGSGKPVDLGSDGSSPTGTAPAVFFSGNAASFATNRGTGGAFTIVAGALTNASTSPSD